MLKFVRRGEISKESDGQPRLRRRPPRRKHFYSWVATDYKQLALSEKLVLKGLKYHQALIAGVNTISTDDISRYDETPKVRKATCGTRAEDDYTDVSFDDEAFISSSDAEDASDDREVVVLVHGFAWGLAAWAQNWNCLAERYRVYAIDLPGFARSERRPTNVHTLEESMEVMTGYLERWCKRLNFSKKVVFVAHSFGCFVCAHFAMRFPEYVKVLALTEPWGINKADPTRIKKVPMTVRFLLHMFYATNPLSMLRGLGPAGPIAFKKSRPDFARNWARFLEDPDVMYDYLYHCNARSPPVGETLFRVCCHCDIAAKTPLPEVLPRKLSRGIPVGILFGADSWITPGEALEMARLMRALGFTVLTDTVQKAGHQLFTDNVEEFNEKIVSMVEELLPSAGSFPDAPSESVSSPHIYSPVSTAVEPVHAAAAEVDKTE